ncbi:helix-turn-helix domain-containing protein [Rhizobium sp. TRM95796]|uniref:helix-turn-helix domain-containing protein n=1 Tax=Rhizobium sp. TRM95796 TaxID=2979862 RepID=UPI0021E7290E|nr:helix-turn-helix domain-containing protein [Rhizobium sp. TRM95796]MCV3765604.1 helix-turn-helix domain-containing protein [Rhizobium sp. TRM95796]
MTTVHDIGHVTPENANIFTELGFAADEAERLQADSEARITAAIAIKKSLMAEIAAWIRDGRLKQAEAAERLNVSRPRVSDVVNMKVSKFTIDTLIDMAQRIGKTVEVTVRNSETEERVAGAR